MCARLQEIQCSDETFGCHLNIWRKCMIAVPSIAAHISALPVVFTSSSREGRKKKFSVPFVLLSTTCVRLQCIASSASPFATMHTVLLEREKKRKDPAV